MKLEHVVYLGPFSFPEGGAAARRILGVAKSLMLSGKKVTIVSGQNKSDYAHETFDGIDVISIGERTAEKFPKIIKHLVYFGMGRKTISWLDSLEEKPTYIILYSGYSPYLLRLNSWCRKNNVKLIFDAVEWYQAESLIKHCFMPYYLNVELAMRKLIPKVGNVIAISNYLKSYYESKGCNVVRVPPTLDIPEINNFYKPYDSIKFVYCGSPGKKDLLWKVINVLSDIRNLGYKFEYHIAGLSLEDAKLIYGGDLSFCFFHGSLSFEKVQKLIRECHYTILFRPNNKVSKAGFPTKVVESMANGVPVITNNTSDLSGIVSDGVNGYIFDGFSEREIKAKLIAILGVVYNSTMPKLAYETARQQFSASSYSKSINDFLIRCK
ncbi:glycosyltransferase family 4 protein [Vibrio sp. WXL210]|uniref:glycosyltransferase family 4 protein n=1 Tax=Vibrio sp. WXL210 TaxID=3450709 RepID=UPI003EC663D6